MKIFFAGDIVGSPGRQVFARVVTRMKASGEAEVVVVNGENAAAGRGLTAKLAEELFACGADIITLGDHTWDQRDIGPYLERKPNIVRPANFAPGCPGRGLCTIDTPHGKLTVISLIGRVFMNPYDCPFQTVDELLKHERRTDSVILVDLHAEATSEKVAMGWHLDGRVSGVVGTHTHVQTSDERILPKGTAYLTDLGMTGAKDSVIGVHIKPVLDRFLTGLPTKFEVATENVVCEGLWMDVDTATGRARKVKRIRTE